MKMYGALLDADPAIYQALELEVQRQRQNLELIASENYASVAVMTAMDEPLGRFAGNWVEVWECVDILKNVRHPMSADLIELSNILSGWMLYLGGKAPSPEAGALLSDEMLTTGAAYKTWLEMVELQGGECSVFEDPAAQHRPKATRVVRADRSGYLFSMDCTQVGWAVQRLGAGRLKPGDPVSANAGLEVHVKLGSRVVAGQPLLTLFAEDAALLDEPEAMLRATYDIALEPPTLNPLVREILTAAQD